MASKIYIDINDVSGVISCNVTDSHGSPTAIASIVCTNCGLGVGDHISIDMGYSGNYDTVFTGYVKSVELKSPEREYTITASNVLIRAVDFFIASKNPDEPFERDHISAGKLVEDIMELAGLTNYDGDNSAFTFGINQPVQVNLVSSYDFSKFVADLLAWHVWADVSGKVHFKDRKPYYSGGSSQGTFNSNNLVNATHTESDRDLRNRVVVYGAEGVYAEAKHSSPFLPAGFYKTAVVSAPGVITTQSMAQQAADYNLTRYNRLTKRCNISALGDSSIKARGNVTISIPSLSVSGGWYAYGVEHIFNKSGFLTNIDGRK